MHYIILMILSTVFWLGFWGSISLLYKRGSNPQKRSDNLPREEDLRIDRHIFNTKFGVYDTFKHSRKE
jgi:hypothetical protein